MKKIITIIMIISLTSCVQKMRDITINFSVDMSTVQNVKSVGVIGETEPLNWETAYPLYDLDGDGIYTGTIVIKAAYNYVEFKFKLNEESIELKGQGNRYLDFTNNTVISYKGVYDQK